jgi:hypothetical protein
MISRLVFTALKETIQVVHFLLLYGNYLRLEEAQLHHQLLDLFVIKRVFLRIYVLKRDLATNDLYVFEFHQF